VAGRPQRAGRPVRPGQLLPALKPRFDDFAARGGDPEVLAPVFGVRAAYLRTALDEMRSRFGTIQSYFADGVRIGADDQAALRGRLLATA
jgi:protein-tyrosine phosphatase